MCGRWQQNLGQETSIQQRALGYMGGELAESFLEWRSDLGGTLASELSRSGGATGVAAATLAKGGRTTAGRRDGMFYITIIQDVAEVRPVVPLVLDRLEASRGARTVQHPGNGQSLTRRHWWTPRWARHSTWRKKSGNTARGTCIYHASGLGVLVKISSYVLWAGQLMDGSVVQRDRQDVWPCVR